MLTTVDGAFFRSIVSGREHLLLERPRPTDGGRYHAPGQSALYMSATAEWARLVAGWYTSRDGHNRVLFPLSITEAHVLDLGDADACRAFGIDVADANASWREALNARQTPPSWGVADVARQAGADGLIDRSRMFPGAWHVTLFDWNVVGRPQVFQIGDGELIASQH
jgi:RES domain-containing protein